MHMTMKQKRIVQFVGVTLIGLIGMGSSCNCPGMQGPVMNPPVNPPVNPLAPTIAIGLQNTLEVVDGKSVTMTVSATDPNGRPLKYEWSTDERSIDLTKVTINTATFNVPTLPDCAQEKTIKVTVKVSASDSDFSTSEGAVKVRSVWCTYKKGENGAGIASNTVNSIAIGNNGLIWLATDAGLNRFEVEKNQWNTYFKAEGLGGNDVRVVAVNDAVGGNGDVWVHSVDSGTFRSDLWGAQIVKLNALGDPIKFEDPFLYPNISNNRVRAFAFNAGKVYIATTSGADIYDASKPEGSQWEHITEFDSTFGNYSVTAVKAIGSDQWYAKGSSGVVRMDNNQLRNEYSQNLWGGGGYAISAIERGPDRFTTLWIGLEGGGIARGRLLEPDPNKRWKLLKTNSIPSMANNNIQSIAIDEGKNVWFASKGGLMRYVENGNGEFVSIKADKVAQPKGLQVDTLTDLAYRKQDQTLWIATDGGGLTRLWLGGIGNLPGYTK
jgi:hypothetical protein